jgi:A/G-specific adenine glycosylase
MEKSDFAARLLTWYVANARSLPWRGIDDPYAVLVSEFMLQQTRVETVIPYYERWMRLFPDIETLAGAPLDAVLKAWEGLGYYSRARSLHQAARTILAEHGGRVPEAVDELRDLPGVGDYTAAAVASIAFGTDAAALDGNLRRVLARIDALDADPRSPAGLKHLNRLAAHLLPPGRAGDFNQALMDLSSQVCLPRKPRCPDCPLADLCEANRQGLTESIPLKTKKAAVPTIIVTAGVIRRGNTVLLSRRPANGLLGGMWEFPGGKQEPGESLPECLARELSEELGVVVSVGTEMGVFKHAYTHFKVVLHAFACEIVEGEPRPLASDGLVWVGVKRLGEYAMGKIDRMIAGELQSGRLTSM